MLFRTAALFTALLLTSACTAQTPQAASQGFQEGKDYTTLPAASPLLSNSDRIEVVEVFGYSCIHCANLAPVIATWKQQQPEDVQVVYMPLASGGTWEAFARAYYTAETMGVLDRTHVPMFQAVHSERRAFRGLDDIAAFYGEHGVDKEQFLATMESFAVNAKIARAQQQAPRWQIEATPTIVVAGKYRVMPGQGGFDRMLQITEFLVERERAARSAG